ncbi:MAG: hypothetical protein HUU29_10450 [Planctomycetaceae bacterium]|nr:hypothetical protein [Planctomycetaceae bacterium]
MVCRVLLLVSLIAAAPLAAGSDTDYFATRLLDDAGARIYLEMKATQGLNDLGETKLMRADLNGDKVNDYALAVWRERSSIVAVFLANGDGIDTAAYTGYVTLDSNVMPAVRLDDITGDGIADVRVEATKKTAASGMRRVIKFANIEKDKLRTVFFAMLDDVERDDLNRCRSTHLVRIKDCDSDGINEIEVSTRNVELIGKGEKEREIAESVSTTRAIYKLKDGVYRLESSKRIEPTAEERLVVAAKLSDSGEHQRAALAAHTLLESKDLPKAVVERARTILDDSMGNGAVLTERATMQG